MKLEKKYLIYGIGIILLTLIGVTLAYFATVITGTEKDITVSFADLKIVFTDIDGSITASNIEPGWSASKTFSVENKTNKSYKYNIVIEDLLNTFKTTGYLVYKITSTDGGYNMKEYKDVPKSSYVLDTALAYDITITSKDTHTYTIEFKYLNSTTVDQSDDMLSTLSGNIYITEGNNGQTLAEAILRDNPVVKTRSGFGYNSKNTTGTIYYTNKAEDNKNVYYYSGNTTNNWVKFGKETTSSCTYNGYEVTYLELNDDGTYTSRRALTESECTSSYVCVTSSNVLMVGLDEAGCKKIGGEYINKDKTRCDYEEGYFEFSETSLESCEQTVAFPAKKPTWSSTRERDIYWRIIRTNEDGSVRLLYAGNNSGGGGFIGYSAFDEDGNLGYMYGGNTSLADNRTNTTSSTIKTYVDTWYQNNLLASYDNYISKSAIYCNDRSYNSYYNWGESLNFVFSERNDCWEPSPNYKCGTDYDGNFKEGKQSVSDKFSVSTTGGGNGQLTYPVALMTADETIFASGYFMRNSASKFWTITPYGFSSGKFYNMNNVVDYPLSELNAVRPVSELNAVRPVISIVPCAKISGFGTKDYPYEITGIAGTCSDVSLRYIEPVGNDWTPIPG